MTVVFFLLGDAPASELYVPTFRNIKFRSCGIAQKKEYSIHNTASLKSRTSDSLGDASLRENMCKVSNDKIFTVCTTHS